MIHGVDTRADDLQLYCCPAHLVHWSKSEAAQYAQEIPKIVHLKKAESTLGRDRNSVDVFLDSERYPRMISRIHAYLLHLEDGSWKIRDNRSVNGLFVNDTKVQEAELKDGDILTFGGGGNLPYGAKRRQDNSEFIYYFRITADYKHPRDRKRKVPTADEAGADEEEANITSKSKKPKLDSDESVGTNQNELEANQNELEEQPEKDSCADTPCTETTPTD